MATSPEVERWLVEKPDPPQKALRRVREIILRADTEFRAKAMRDLLESKAIRRGLSLKIFDWTEIEEAGGNTVRQTIKLKRGLPDDLAKKITWRGTTSGMKIESANDRWLLATMTGPSSGMFSSPSTHGRK